MEFEFARGFGVCAEESFILGSAGEKMFPVSVCRDGNALTAKYESGKTRTYFEADGGSVSGFSQSYSGGNAVSGVSLAFSLDKSLYSVIVPAWNGVRISGARPRFWTGWTDCVEYGQTDLQLRMLIFEGADGGYVLWSEDEGDTFTRFYVRDGGNRFIVNVVTMPPAPFDEIFSFRTEKWRMLRYSGSWQNGAEYYKRFTERKRIGKGVRKPDWTGDIHLAFLTDLWNDREQIIALSELIDPKHVLLHLPGWRKEPYDINLPDYTPRTCTEEDIRFAHSLGYKVQLHFNMNGFQQQKPEFEKYAEYQVRDRYTGEPVYAEYTAGGVHVKFAQMNPASAEWRDYITEKISRAAFLTGCDSVHLDESLFARNDWGGLIGGMTPIRGNIEYHRRLNEMLPAEVAIGGEGITDFNAMYGSFMQTHVYGVDPPRPFDPGMQSQIVPVTAYVFGGSIVPYHWPGMPVTGKTHEYLEWHVAGEATGLCPTVMRDGAEAFRSDGVIRSIVGEAAFLAAGSARRIFDGVGGDVLMRYGLNGGTVAAFVKKGDGYVFLKNENDEKSALYEITRDDTGRLGLSPGESD